MSHEVLLLEQHAELYAASLRPAFPDVVFHTARPGEALPDCAGVEAIVALAHEVRDDIVATMPRLRWIAALTTGTDHLETLTRLPPDVTITSARGIHGPQMSEMAFLSMIALSRDFQRMQANQKAHVWERWPQRLLLGKTAVLVGVGAISEDLALRCKAFGMRVVGISSARTDARGFDTIVPRAALKTAVAEADFVIVLVPYSPATHFMIDHDVLAAMKPSAILINLARGNVIDEQALIAALAAKTIGGAGLDVFAVEPLPASSPLWDMENVIVTPRVGGMSDVYAQQSLPLLTHNMQAFVDDRLDAMQNVVRGPTVKEGRA